MRTMNDKAIPRRDFIRLSGLVGGWFGLSIWLPSPASAGPDNEPSVSFSPDVFVEISRDNTIVFNLPKQEMGQGISTGLAMIFADELGADFDRMLVRQADYDPRFGNIVQGVTGGSNSMRACWQPLREAAARVRDLMVTVAAERWQVEPTGCLAEDSFVIHRPTGRRLPFGSLIEQAAQKPIPAEARLKDPSEYRYIGKPLGNRQTRRVVLGQMRYGIDLEVPGMVHAVIARCPFFRGTLRHYADSAARNIPGVLDVVAITPIRKAVKLSPDDNNPTTYPYTIAAGVAVVATSTWAAMQGRNALTLEWDSGPFGNVSNQALADQLRAAEQEPGEEVFHHGSVNQPIARATRMVEAQYDTQFQAHAIMEPLNAVAHVKNGQCEVWVGHQYGRRVAEETAALLNIPVDQVTVHILPSGGAFGRRWEADFALEAVIISKQVGKPVKVTWTREDEIQHDYYHAYERDHHRVALGEQGNITAWDLKRYTYDFFAGWSWNPYRYGVPASRMRAVILESPLQTGSWRSVDSHRETFARESFVDELAHALGKDPLAYRLDLLSKPLIVPAGVENPDNWLKRAEDERRKTRQILELAAQEAGWGSKKGIGIAVTNYCAQVVEVALEDGKLRVIKVTAAMDCGRVINPSLVKGQVEGSIIWGLQAVLYGGISLRGGRVQQSNFHDYKMIRMAESPPIDVHLVDSQEPPTGTGEPGVPALAPALLNAVFALTGQRIRQIPMGTDLF